VPSSRESAAVTSWDQGADHPLFAAESYGVGAQSVTPVWPPMRRLGLSAWGGASGPARLPTVHFVICAAWVFLCSGALFDGSARAVPASIAGTASPRAALPFTAFVAEASQRFNIPGNWIRAGMRVESFSDPRAISPKGAIGLMQVMPKTYAELRGRHRLGADPCDPHDNILAGAAYLREMPDRYGAPGFLAAYNAGPARYDEHLMRGRPLPGETQDYVANLAPVIGVQQGEDQKGTAFDLFAWSHAALFPPHADPSPGAVLLSLRAQPDRSPAVRRVVDLSALAPSSEGLFVRLARETGSR
jgi:Transglycosylase SLT domain